MLLERMAVCPLCGSSHFVLDSEKSRRCRDCGFEYFMNPSSANVALIFNQQQELLVVRRKNDPAKGTLDLPGGFADMKETGLEVTALRYLFSFPNQYEFSGVTLPTLDLFFACEVADERHVKALDDAAEAFWLPLEKINPNAFGLDSIRRGVEKFVKARKTTT